MTPKPEHFRSKSFTTTNLNLQKKFLMEHSEKTILNPHFPKQRKISFTQPHIVFLVRSTFLISTGFHPYLPWCPNLITPPSNQRISETYYQSQTKHQLLAQTVSLTLCSLNLTAATTYLPHCSQKFRNMGLHPHPGVSRW